MHLDRVAVGVANIWEEEYTTAAGVKQRGLTAAIYISIEGDPAQNRNLRVHPGQEVSVPGYRLQVVAIEAKSVQLAVIDVPR